MRNILIILTIALLLPLVACKTTEANYRSAYEAAVAQRDESAGIDSTIYARIRNSAVSSRLISGTDSLPMRTEYINYTKDGGASRESVKLYNVVAGQFKQIFNANQMRKRLIDNGYPDAFIIETREPLYYVVSATTADADSAAAAWRRIDSDPQIVLRQPCPFILRPASLVR